MAEHFAIQMCRELRLPLFPGFTDRAKETLLHYARPGNVRELKNVVERSVYRHGSSEHPLDEIVIDPFQRHPPNRPRPPCHRHPPRLTCRSTCGSFNCNRKALLQRSLQQAKFNQKRAADLLALTYHQFRALLKSISFSYFSG